ncbi:MAG TPA: MBL fold metallo-hydrolase [Thermoanaerobaculia bacterium]|nr:MBL fold metallo-hydrolase [Thermoanaerobaculia bacterium]
MKTSFWRFWVCSVFALSLHAAPPHVIFGKFVPGQQPDGNTVVFETDDGLVVIDTGRHRAHTQQILDYIDSYRGKRPVAAVVNTHWHLDHIGGNALFPEAKVYASAALDDALGGFLASYAKQLEDIITKTSGEEQQRYRTELALIRNGKSLLPDVVVTADRTLGPLELHLEKDAVTAGDLWIYDPRSKTLVAGDLITLPVPFLDTACPAKWKDALDRLAAVKFERVVPGHGPVLSRAQFERYRTAYANFLSCEKECEARWLTDVGDLVPESEHAFTRQLLGYYLGLRKRCVT